MLLVPEASTIKATFVGLADGFEYYLFLSSFLANLSAGILLAILGYLFFPGLLRLWHKPEVRFLLRGGDRGKIFKMTKAKDGNWEGTMHLRIKNDSRSVLRQYYWHLLIPSILNPKIIGHDGGLELQSESYENSALLHWKGKIEDSIFIERSFVFPFEIKMKTSSSGHWDASYWFSTEFGMFPKNAKLIETDSHKTIEKGYLGKLEISTEE